MSSGSTIITNGSIVHVMCGGKYVCGGETCGGKYVWEKVCIHIWGGGKHVGKSVCVGGEVD